MILDVHQEMTDLSFLNAIVNESFRNSDHLLSSVYHARLIKVSNARKMSHYKISSTMHGLVIPQYETSDINFADTFDLSVFHV